MTTPAGGRPQRVARFQLHDGRVVLGPDGVRLVLAAIEAAWRGQARRNGGAVPTSDLAWLCASLAAASARGSAAATSGRRFTLAVPSSEATVTVAEAAAILHISGSAVRKPIKAGRLTARRHGGVWVLAEAEVRQAGTRRTDGSRRQPGVRRPRAEHPAD
jgi:hypothetical protein